MSRLAGDERARADHHVVKRGYRFNAAAWADSAEEQYPDTAIGNSRAQARGQRSAR